MKAEGRRIEEAWIPVVTPEDNYNCGLMLHTTDVHSDAGLSAIGFQPTVRGIVTNNLSGLSSKLRRQLEGAYRIDYETLVVVDYNAKPSGTGTFLLKLAGFAALLGAAYFTMARATEST